MSTSYLSMYIICEEKYFYMKNVIITWTHKKPKNCLFNLIIHEERIYLKLYVCQSDINWQLLDKTALQQFIWKNLTPFGGLIFISSFLLSCLNRATKLAASDISMTCCFLSNNCSEGTLSISLMLWCNDNFST